MFSNVLCINDVNISFPKSNIKPENMKFILKMIVLFAMPFANALAQNQTDSMVVKNLQNLQWQPKKTLPAGAMSAVVYGEPIKGNYDFYGKFPDSYTVPKHWHTNDCMVIILKGSMTIKREKFPDATIEQGGFFTLPGKMKYIAYCAKECIFLVHGAKPFDIFYENPKDDPRNQPGH